MLSLMPLVTFFVCVAYFFSVVRMLIATAEAPIGYEDADGFHYGLDPTRVER